MIVVQVTVALAAIGALAGMVWVNRHCLRRTWLDRIVVAIMTSSCVLIAASNIGRISPHIDAMPGNVRAWLWVILLLGVVVLLIGKALERKR